MSIPLTAACLAAVAGLMGLCVKNLLPARGGCSGCQGCSHCGSCPRCRGN